MKQSFVLKFFFGKTGDQVSGQQKMGKIQKKG
jgi:hypothetical protein